ncbi:MAG TPA: universal stress protein [Geobacteraceae bacterium]|nr:universal stress protein [Geobacteraceae bacterium]
MEEVRRILVVSRSTRNCRFAVESGVSLARRYGADLYVLYLSPGPFDLDSMHMPERFVPEEYGKYESGQQAAEMVADQIISREMEKGLPIRKLVKHGIPVEEVEKVVVQEKIDLIVMHAQKEGLFEHFLFGGDTGAIIRSMPCSILLMKKEEK